MAWGVVYTEHRREQSAHEKLSKAGFTVYYPTLSKTIRHARRNEIKILPSFPRYLFVEMSDRWAAIRRTQYVQGVLSYGNGEIAKLSNTVVDNLRRVMRHMDGEGTKVAKFIKNDKVRVGDGPFSGFHGIYLQSLDDAQRGQVLLTMFGREVRVVLPFEHLEAL